MTMNDEKWNEENSEKSCSRNSIPRACIFSNEYYEISEEVLLFSSRGYSNIWQAYLCRILESALTRAKWTMYIFGENYLEHYKQIVKSIFHGV